MDYLSIVIYVPQKLIEETTSLDGLEELVRRDAGNVAARAVRKRRSELRRAKRLNPNNPDDA